MHEFDIIARYFRPLTNGDMLQDDAAILRIPEGQELIITSDTLNAGTHFLKNESAGNIARKALRVNLSDLASMGASPLSYQLNLAFPQKPSDSWLTEFTNALAQDQKEFGIFCSGGDTTSIIGETLSISITALGTVPKGKALHRKNAKAGDLIMLTGPIGDAFLGLKALRENLDYTNAIQRHRLPQPRLQSAHIRNHVHAAADISDGLIADLGHIANASNLAAEIHLDKFIFSDEIKDAFSKNILKPEDALTGGDDYELVLTTSSENEAHILQTFPKAFTIGHMKPGQGVSVMDKNSQTLNILNPGWSHF